MDITLTHTTGSIDTAFYDSELPGSYTMTFECDGTFMVCLRVLSNGAHNLIHNLDSNKVTFTTFGAIQKLSEFIFEHDATQRNKVAVQFHEIQFGDYSDERWHVFSVWINDAHAGTFYDKPDESWIESSYRVGFAIPSDVATKQYYNVRVPELAPATDWGSIDPNEPPIGSINRAIDGLHIKFFMRFNGSIRAWVSKPSLSARTFSTDDIEDLEWREDLQSIKTVVRVVGGYSEATYSEYDLVRRYGHRFIEINNPYLLSEDECYKEAQRAMRRIKESSLEEGFRTPQTPFLEPEDRITTPNGDRIINSISTDYTGPENTQTLSTRRYAYDS